MITSRNPKVLNKVVMQKLNPLLAKVTDLVNMSSDVKNFIDENVESKNTNMETVSNITENFHNSQDIVYTEIDKSNTLLSEMIVADLSNPNTAPGTGGGESGTPIEETKLINDKTLFTVAYGFVKDGVSMTLAGVSGKGLAVGENPAYEANFEFKNESNDKFSSQYVRDILLVNPTRAFISTNNGLVDYNVETGNYINRDNSFGLNTKRVVTCTHVKTSDSTQTGFIAGTEVGVNYSPTGERWVNVDKTFKASVTCLSRTQSHNLKQTILFIGTDSGLYFVDLDEFLIDGVSKVHHLKNISNALPSTYINSVAYNTVKDTLYVATDGGLTVVTDVMAHLKSNYDSGEKYTACTTYTSRSGLSSTLCLDIFLKTDSTVIIGTTNALTVTKDFANFTYITKKQSSYDQHKLLNSHMCKKIVRRDASTITVIHTVGLTEGLSINI